MTTPEALANLTNGDRAEVLRALIYKVAKMRITDAICFLTPEGPTYEIELPEATITLGSALSAQTKLRDILRPYAEEPMEIMRLPAWEKFVWQFSHLCRKEIAGELRHDERVTEWMAEYAEGVIDYPPGPRNDALRSRPILYEDHIATKLRPLMVWLERVYGEKFTSHQLGKLLKSAGWENKTIWVTEEKRMKVWIAPTQKVYA